MIWIDVKEKLPEAYEKVLFHWIGVGNDENVSMGYFCKSDWHIYQPFYSPMLYNKLCEVTHWTELPEFPGENKES